MGVRKQSLELATNKPLASLALQALKFSSVSHVVVVVHPEDPLSWLPKREKLSASHSFAEGSPVVSIAPCREASKGMAHSIKYGLGVLLEEDPTVEAVCIALADQPFISAERIEELILYWRSQPELDFVATTSGELSEGTPVLMPPAVIARSMFAALMELEGDVGARKLFQSSVFKGEGLTVSDKACLMDVDTVSEMEAAKNHYSKGRIQY